MRSLKILDITKFINKYHNILLKYYKSDGNIAIISHKP